jgi:hypothetical protein
LGFIYFRPYETHEVSQRQHYSEDYCRISFDRRYSQSIGKEGGNCVMSNMELWLEEWVERDGMITIGATLEQTGETAQRLWYRLPARFRPAITRSANPFVAGFLFRAMQLGGKLAVHGEVSPSLLRNIEELGAAWLLWRPNTYHRVEITADNEKEANEAEGEITAMMFSGGADSSFTAWRHRNELAGRQQRNLQAGIMVHGFDIPLDRQEEFNGAAESAGQMLASLQMEMVPLATNFREIEGNWEDSHGAGLASCLMLLQGRYQSGLIASGYAYSHLVLPYGSNPLTDRMFSSDTFEIVHDGAGFNRLEKTRCIIQWPEVLDHLRVCYEGKDLSGNCCRCQKCIGSLLYFRIFGLKKLACFPDNITNFQILFLRYRDMAQIKSMSRILTIGQEMNLKASWLIVLRVSVWMNLIFGFPKRQIRPPIRKLERIVKKCVRR